MLCSVQYSVRENHKENDYIGYTNPDDLNRVLRVEHSPWKKFVEANPPNELITEEDQLEIEKREKAKKEFELMYQD